MGIHSIAVPPLGCGSGGLDWREPMERKLADVAGVRWPSRCALVRKRPQDTTTEPTRLPAALQAPHDRRRDRVLFLVR